jgi:hypothetical protein
MSSRSINVHIVTKAKGVPKMLRIVSTVLALTVGASVGFLTACSAGGSPSLATGEPPSNDIRDLFAPRAATNLEAQRSTAARKRRVERDLFISNFDPVSGNGNILVLKNKTYKQIRVIKEGTTGPSSLWVDSRGNLYLANQYGSDVLEYRPRASSPSCTYSAGLVGPSFVTTDDAGNVYVSDYQNGDVVKYAQCQNTVLKQWSAKTFAFGIAVDSQGDLFVAYLAYGHTNKGIGYFEEFKGGSSTPTQLGATVSFPGSLIIDRNGNLIADDQSGNIDVIAPPYSSAKALVSGLNGPYGLSLNRQENLLFSANTGARYSSSVTVYDYPSGQLVTTLGASNGVTRAYGVAESPEATF